MNIYIALKKYHHKIRSLLERLAIEPHNKDLLNQLEEDFLFCADAEEKLFYKPFKDKLGKLTFVIDSSQDEHSIAKKLISLYSEELELEKKAILLLMLKKVIEAHIDKEDNEVFELAKYYLSEEEAKHMAEAFENEMKNKNKSY